MSFKKMKTIAKAFLEPLPEGEQWYEDRLKICAECPMNSANVPKDKMKLSDKISIKKGLCDNGNHCTACGCCIERKCATKTETCGLKEIGQKPKWEALVVESEFDPALSVENLTPEMFRVSQDKEKFTFDFGEITDSGFRFSFRIKSSRKDLKVKSYRPSCSCVFVEKSGQPEDNVFEMNVHISTVGFRKGLTSRKLYVTYLDSNDVPVDLTIMFLIRKPNGV